MAEKKQTTADILAMKAPRIKTASIQMNGALADQVEKLQEQIREAKARDRRSNAQPEAPRLEQELADLLEKGRETQVEFTFRALGREAMDDLAADHQPDEEQRKDNPGIQWNPDTFPPALIAAASEKPKLSVKQALEIWKSPDWNQAEVVALFSAALEVNTELPKIPFSSTVTGMTRSTG